MHLTGDIQAEGDSCHDDCYAEESDKHRNQISGVWGMVVKAFHVNVSPRPETRFPWGRLPASLNLCASQIAQASLVAELRATWRRFDIRRRGAWRFIMPEFPPDKDPATTSVSTTTMAFVLAGIVAVLIFVGYLYEHSREAHVNQPSTQSLAQDKIPDTSKTE